MVVSPRSTLTNCYKNTVRLGVPTSPQDGRLSMRGHVYTRTTPLPAADRAVDIVPRCWLLDTFYVSAKTYLCLYRPGYRAMDEESPDPQKSALYACGRHTLSQPHSISATFCGKPFEFEQCDPRHLATIDHGTYDGWGNHSTNTVRLNIGKMYVPHFHHFCDWRSCGFCKPKASRLSADGSYSSLDSHSREEAAAKGGKLRRSQPTQCKPRNIVAVSRSQTPGDVTQSETAALRIGQLSLEGKAVTPVPSHRTSSGRKRAAKSDIDHCNSTLDDGGMLTALGGPQQSVKCFKRFAWGDESPFPPGAPAKRDDQCGQSHFTNTCATHTNHQRAKPAFPAQAEQQQPDHPPPNCGDEGLHMSTTLQFNSGPNVSKNVGYSGILSQPESRPITSDQLATEVKNIYSKLVAVEAKCVSLDNIELASSNKCIDIQESEKWQALMALHRTLLYEHHDFLSASQHPAAHEPLRKLALKYSMPARMWKHAIHSFLEVLRRRLPDSMDYMLQFIYTAYQMIALLYETLDAFKSTWIECLGDLARYRMAIEDGIQRDRETWGMVARSWYSLASDLHPHVGRLYHHLGILARPHAVQQLHLYSRSLTCIEPFPNARESLATLMESVSEAEVADRASSYVDNVDVKLLRLHQYMFMDVAHGIVCDATSFTSIEAQYSLSLGEQIESFGLDWKPHGVFVAVANIAACFAYGYQEAESPLALALKDDGKVVDSMTRMFREKLAWEQLRRAVDLLFLVLSTVVRRRRDLRVLPHVHVVLVFVCSMAAMPADAGSFIGDLLRLVPWLELVAFLNSFTTVEPISRERVDGAGTSVKRLDGFRGDLTPLPEDFSLRGEVWAEHYFTDSWFRDAPGEETRYLEQASTDKTRIQRVHWLGVCISKVRSRRISIPSSCAKSRHSQQYDYLNFSCSTRKFSFADDMHKQKSFPKVTELPHSTMHLQKQLKNGI